MRERDAADEAVDACQRLIVRAERRLGEITGAMETSAGGRPTETPRESRGVSKAAQLAEHGIAQQSASEYEQLAAIPEAQLEQHEKALQQEGKRATRGRILARHKGKRSPKASRAGFARLAEVLDQMNRADLEALQAEVEKRLARMK